MYNVQKVMGIRPGINQVWEDVDYSTISVQTLYNTFKRWYVALCINGTSNVVFLDMYSIKPAYAFYPSTISNLMAMIGESALNTTTVAPSTNVVVAKYKDAFMAGYNATLISPLYNTNAAPENKTAVLLTRSIPVTDYNDFYRHCLVSINGYYHLTDTNGTNGIVVYDATSSLRIANQNQIGLFSFENVCNIELVPITIDMVHKKDPNEPYSSSAYIKLNKDLTNKSIMMVLGGYLHVVDPNTFNIVGSDIVKIDFSNYPILDRYYESIKYLNLSSLQLSKSTVNESQVSVEELTSDEKLLAYMTLSQSFFVILDTPEIFTIKQNIKKSNLYGTYVSYNKPQYPLVTNLGRHPEYVSIEEDGQYAIKVHDNITENKIFDTVNPSFINNVANSNIPFTPLIPANAFFLCIGRNT